MVLGSVVKAFDCFIVVIVSILYTLFMLYVPGVYKDSAALLILLRLLRIGIVIDGNFSYSKFSL